jgi:hypothetical protein
MGRVAVSGCGLAVWSFTIVFNVLSYIVVGILVSPQISGYKGVQAFAST